MSSKKIGAIIALDGERSFKQSVTNCNRTLAQLKAEMELVRAQSEGQEDDLESLGNRHEVLTRILEAHKKKEEEVEKGLQHSRESYAQMGEKLQDLRDELQQATKKLQEMEVLSGKLNDVPSGRLFRADLGFLQMCQSL